MIAFRYFTDFREIFIFLSLEKYSEILFPVIWRCLNLKLLYRDLQGKIIQPTIMSWQIYLFDDYIDCLIIISYMFLVVIHYQTQYWNSTHAKLLCNIVIPKVGRVDWYKLLTTPPIFGAYASVFLSKCLNGLDS